MKKLAVIALISSLSLPAQAGFWDSLFGGGDSKEAAPEPATEPNKEPPPPAAESSASASSSMAATGMQLLPLLSQSLGVSGAQAAGGMGSLLQAAQTLLSNSEFATIAKAIPGVETLMRAAPAVSAATGGGGMMGSAMDMASKYSPQAKAGSELVSQFKSLGMGADMIPKFTEVGSSYLQQNGNGEASTLLSSAMGGIL
ncbi:DUF2780 domain-containing protein [Litorivivens sp.]|uniref:DUF2780 domain-containing protein n=2 Tax=Litorivivens sp. TaxID=2020868 RepID=UPI003567129D